MITNFKVNINKVPSDDPLAFVTGLIRGFSDINKEYKSFEERHGSTYRGLASEYLRGYKLGHVGVLFPPNIKIRKDTERTLFGYEKGETFNSLHEFNEKYKCLDL